MSTTMCKGCIFIYIMLSATTSANNKYTSCYNHNKDVEPPCETTTNLFDNVNKLATPTPETYVLRAEYYFKQKKYPEAVDDAISAINIDETILRAHYIIYDVADSAYNMTYKKLETQAQKHPNIGVWEYDLGVVCFEHKDYLPAATHFKKAYSIEAKDVVFSNITDCYYMAGEYDKALEYNEKAIKADSTNIDLYKTKVEILDEMGRTEDAIYIVTLCIKMEPENSYNYYKRGWLKQYTGDIDGAIEDYSSAIKLDPRDATNYLYRGCMYRMKGDQDKARLDFLEVVRLDSIPEQTECADFAYFYLGEKKKAIKLMNIILEKEKDYYDAACLYSLMGEKEKALTYLRKSLENGYKSFNHIRRDHDLDNIRNTPEFKIMVSEFEKSNKRTE